uniref:Bulb-type lectin domain-containing protein n=1 Tax=Daucus carota subsp. sativus TaxID=79200 RepID=A0A166F590_DAUCS
MVILLFLCLTTVFHAKVVNAQVLGDTLQQGELMNATNSLMSSQKKFSMGFFDGHWGRYLVVHEDAHLSMPDSPGWKLTHDGNIYEHGNVERVIAAVDDCYGYYRKGSKSSPVNNTAGCELFEQPKCRNVMLKFEAQTGFFSNSTDIKYSTDDHITGYSDCKSKCWEDCDCIGFMTNEETECIFYRGTTNTKFHNEDNSNRIYILTTDSANPSHNKRRRDILIVVFILAFYVVLVLLGILHGDQGKNINEEAAATIRAGEQLNSTSQLVSEEGKFTLGFFTAETNFSYFGIWYTNDDQARKVWLANRNQPILNTTSAALAIDKTGQLVITSAGRIVVNVSDQGYGGNISATLQDDGNFVLADESDRRVLWQSFDDPTDTLLPGMKLGSNLTAGKNWTLNSGFSAQVPASGAFSLSWEPFNESNQLVIRRRGEVYWTSGRLMQSQDDPALQTFEFMTLNSPFDAYKYNLSTRDDAEARYFTYIFPRDGRFPMWILDFQGNIRQDDSFNLATTAFCLGYDNGNGCVASSGLPVCRSQDLRFEEKNAEFINGDSTFDDNTTISLSDCMRRCWDDCNCLGFVNSSNGTGCTMYFGTSYTITDQPNSVSKYVLVSSKTDKKAKGSKWVWIVIAVVVSLVLLILASFCVFRMRKTRLKEEEERKREKYLQELIASDSFNNPDETGGMGALERRTCFGLKRSNSESQGCRC